MGTLSESKRNQAPFSLSHDDHRTVRVDAEGGDRFFMTVAESTVGCKVLTMLNEARQTLNESAVEAQRQIVAWCRAHSEVSRALGGYFYGNPAVVLLTDGARHRVELEDDVTDLDIELHQKWPALHVELRTVPEDRAGDLSAYLDKVEAELYVRGRES